jgi:CelD/BcsL family acetyltransferase involved in cellulose biosynthesis
VADVASLEWFATDDPGALAALADEWRDLARSGPAPSLFVSPEWTSVWWRLFGATRRPHLVGARRDGKLVALAPLCTRRARGLRVLEFLGAEEADLASFLLAPGEEGLADELARVALRTRGWDLLDFWCVAEGSPTAIALERGLAARGAGHEVRRLTVNPVLDVAAEGWAADASRSMLKDLARQRRVLGRQGKLELVFPDDVEEVEAALAALRDFHHQRWGGQGEMSRLLLPDYWSWVHGLSLEAWRRGWLYLPSVRLDGRPFAIGLFFLYQRRLFYWMGAHDPAFARHSPNLLLILSVIEDLRAAGSADVLDFGQGDEWYKLRWTQAAVPLARIMAWRGVRGRAAHLWHGRLRPWIWAHPRLTRPLRRARRLLRRGLQRSA